MLKCPACEIPLCQMQYEGVPVRVCPDCRGALVDGGRLKCVERRREAHWTDSQKREIEEEVAAAPSRPPVRCPRCLAPMKIIPLKMGGGKVRVDFCSVCNLYWFDRGELELVQILYEKMEGSRTFADRDRLERAALGEIQMRQQFEDDVADMDRTEIQGLAGAGLLVGVAEAMARCASESLQKGMEVTDRRTRAVNFMVAAVAILLAVAAALAAYYLWWPLRILWESMETP